MPSRNKKNRRRLKQKVSVRKSRRSSRRRRSQKPRSMKSTKTPVRGRSKSLGSRKVKKSIKTSRRRRSKSLGSRKVKKSIKTSRRRRSKSLGSRKVKKSIKTSRRRRSKSLGSRKVKKSIKTSRRRRSKSLGSRKVKKSIKTSRRRRSKSIGSRKIKVKKSLKRKDGNGQLSCEIPYRSCMTERVGPIRELMERCGHDTKYPNGKTKTKKDMCLELCDDVPEFASTDALTCDLTNEQCMDSKSYKVGEIRSLAERCGVSIRDLQNNLKKRGVLCEDLCRPRAAPVVHDVNCIERSELPLRPHQIRVAEYMMNHDALLVVHGTGLGKTLTAVTVSQCFLDEFPEQKVIFIGKASLLTNFKREIVAYGSDPETGQYEYYSFDSFWNKVKSGRSPSCTGNLLIIDEVHNLRNPGSKKTQSIIRCAMSARKRLLLTATPFVNNIQDFVPLINMLYGRNVAGTKQSENAPYIIPKTLDERAMGLLGSVLVDKVDYEDTKDERYFPDENIEYVACPMSQEYFERFEPLSRGQEVFGLLFAEPQRFYNAYRRLVNQAGPEYFSDKIDRALPILRSGRSIIYSNWIEFGVKTIQSILDTAGISYGTFSGDTPPAQRDKLVAEFNNEDIQTLIITKAGGEGLDLKRVNNVIVLDPPWNNASLRQIIGRAVRYKSHWSTPGQRARLTPEQRTVNVYLMVLTEPGVTNWDLAEGEGTKSGDRLLYRIIQRKHNETTQINNAMERWTI